MKIAEAALTEVERQSTEFECDAQGTLPELLGSRIVIVEDNDDARHFLAIALTTSGAVVETFSSISQLLPTLTSLDVDLFILDLALQRESGVELLRLLRTHERPEIRVAPAICLSAHALSGVEKLVVEAGFDRFLSKPISIRSLVTEVARVIHAKPQLSRKTES